MAFPLAARVLGSTLVIVAGCWLPAIVRAAEPGETTPTKAAAADTYPIAGYQHVFLYHRPSDVFVPLARLKNTAQEDDYRVDIHARTTRDGRTVCIDATHEGLGRQMYVVPIGEILDNPPGTM